MGVKNSPSTSTISTISTSSSLNDRYDFEMVYEMNANRSSFFPFKFGYVTYPTERLNGIISQHEYQSIIELINMSGQPHNYIFRDMLIVLIFTLLLPSIITVVTTEYKPILLYFGAYLLVSIYVVIYMIYKLFITSKKKSSITSELKRRGVKLNSSNKFTIHYFVFLLFTLIQAIFCTFWAQYKLIYNSEETINQYQLFQIFLYVFISFDAVSIIYVIYNIMLFTRYRDIITNTNQSDHLKTLTRNVKKFDVVPYYLTYNSQRQPLLTSSYGDDA